MLVAFDHYYIQTCLFVENSSKLYDFFVLDTIQDPHRILILIESVTRWADTISQEPLHLRGQSSRFFDRHHEVLVLSLTIKALSEEQANGLSSLISLDYASVTILDQRIQQSRADLRCYVSPTSVVSVAEEDQGTTNIQLRGNSLIFFWPSLWSPSMAPRNHNRGAILLGRLRYSSYTPQQDREVDIPSVVVTILSQSQALTLKLGTISRIIPMQRLLPPSRIHPESHRRRYLRLTRHCPHFLPKPVGIRRAQDLIHNLHQ